MSWAMRWRYVPWDVLWDCYARCEQWNVLCTYVPWDVPWGVRHYVTRDEPCTCTMYHEMAMHCVQCNVLCAIGWAIHDVLCIVKGTMHCVVLCTMKGNMLHVMCYALWLWDVIYHYMLRVVLALSTMGCALLSDVLCSRAFRLALYQVPWNVFALSALV